MAINPLIALQGRPVEVPNITGARMAMAHADLYEQQAAKAKQDAQNEAELNQALMSTGGQITPEFVQGVAAKNPKVGGALQQLLSRQAQDKLAQEKATNEAAKSKAELKGQEIKNEQERMQAFGNIANDILTRVQGVTDPAVKRSILRNGVVVAIRQGLLDDDQAGSMLDAANELTPEVEQFLTAVRGASLTPDKQQAMTLAQAEEARKAEAEARAKRKFEATIKGDTVDPNTGLTPYQTAQIEQGKQTGDMRNFKEATTNPEFDAFLTKEANRRAPRTTVNVNSGGGDDTAAMIQAITDNPELFNDLPPTERVKLIPALAKAGFTFPEKPMSGEAAKVYSVAETVIKDFQDLRGIIAEWPRLSAAGMLTGLSPTLSRLRDNASDKIGRLRSGGAITETEEKRFLNQIARIMDVVTGDPASALNSLDSMMREAQIVLNKLRPNPPKGKGGDGGSAQRVMKFNPATGRLE